MDVKREPSAMRRKSVAHFLFNIDEDEKDKKPLREKLKDLAESSSLHGIPKIVSSRQIAVKVLWCLLFVATFSVLTYQLVSLFRTYYSYPIQTTVSLEFNAIPYPAISICNMNPVRASKLNQSEELQELLNQVPTGTARRKRETPETSPQVRKQHKGEYVEEIDRKNHIVSEKTHQQHQSDDVDNLLDKGSIDYDDPIQEPTEHEGETNNDIKLDQRGTADQLLSPSELTFREDHWKGDKRLKGARRRKRDNSYSLTATSQPTSSVTSSSNYISSTQMPPPPASSSSFNINSSPISTIQVSDSSNNMSSTQVPSMHNSSISINPSPISLSLASSSEGSNSCVGSGSEVGTACYGTSSSHSGSSSEGSNSCAGSGTELGTACYGTSSSHSGSSSYHAYSSSYDYWDSWNSWWYDYYYSDSYGSGGFDYWDNYYALSTSRKDVWEQRVEDVKSIFRNTSLELRREIGHQKEDLFLSALFAGQVQNISRWRNFSSSDYGNCYTIAAPKYIAWRSGPSHGFKLNLNLEIDEYIANFTTGYGLRLVFHEPGTHPLPSKDGITLSPGTETNIGLRTVKISRLGQPHGDCDTGSDFEKKYRVKYSLTACYEFCRIKATVDVCSCLLPDAPDGMNFNSSAVPVCNSSSTSTESKCVFDLSIKLNEGAYECNCHEPCNEFVYTKTMSSTFWPTDDYLKILLTDICSENRDTELWRETCDNLEYIQYSDIDRIRKNFVRVLIYFEDLNYEQISEDPLYQGVRFLSDIGGAMGLFLGASVLSLVEFAQLVLEIILHFRSKFTSSKDSTRVSNMNFAERT